MKPGARDRTTDPARALADMVLLKGAPSGALPCLYHLRITLRHLVSLCISVYHPRGSGLDTPGSSTQIKSNPNKTRQHWGGV